VVISIAHLHNGMTRFMLSFLILTNLVTIHLDCDTDYNLQESVK